MVLKKTLESPLDCKKIKLVNPKGNQPWRFIGRTDAEAETPILWPPDAKNWLIGKDHDAGKHWRKEDKGTTKDEKVGLYHRLNVQSSRKLWELVKEKEAWHAVIHGITKSWTWMIHWMTEQQQQQQATIVHMKCLMFYPKNKDVYYHTLNAVL